MCSPLNCGSSNFPAEEYDIEELLNPYKAQKKGAKKMKYDKNPYSNRGLDKFNALLAELESKKQKIYTQKGSQDISFIRFVYSSSGDWKPIVVKSKGKMRSDQEDRLLSKSKSKNTNAEKDVHVGKQASSDGEILIISNRSRSRSLFNLMQPSSFYLTAMLILILLLFTISGKTFAILCTTIGWYLLPLINEPSPSSSPIKLDRPFKKNDYTRKLSDGHFVTNGSASPNSVLDAPEVMSPAAKHAHRKSW